jgi:hypothetical protein
VGLEVHPEFWAITEEKAKSECGVCRNASTIVDDLGNAVWRNVNRFCQLVLRHPIFSKEQNLSSSSSSPSVMVNHSDLIGVAIHPSKNHAPLMVDPNGEKALQVSLQLLQAI